MGWSAIAVSRIHARHSQECHVGVQQDSSLQKRDINLTAAQQPGSAHIKDEFPPVILQLRDELRPPVLAEDEIRVNRFQTYLRPQYTVMKLTTMRTTEVQLRSIEEENRHDLDEIRPIRLGPIYRLVVCEPSPFLTVKVEVT